MMKDCLQFLIEPAKKLKVRLKVLRMRATTLIQITHQK